MTELGARHLWLFDRNGRWYLRARVPRDVPNYPKTEVKRSLGTSDYREASRLIHAAAAQLQREFDEYRRYGGPRPKPTHHSKKGIVPVARLPGAQIRYFGRGTPPPDLKSSEELTDDDIQSFTRQLWRSWLGWIAAPLPNSDPDWVEEHVQLLKIDMFEEFIRPASEDTEAFSVGTEAFLERRGYFFDTTGPNGLILKDRILRAGSEAYRRRIERLSGVPTHAYRDTMFDDIPLAVPPSLPSSTNREVRAPRSKLSLEGVIELYENDPKRRDIEKKTREEDRRTFAYMKEVFGAARPISEITRQDCIKFRDAILSIPKNAYRDFRGLRLEELRSIAIERSLPRLTNKGANKYIHKLSAVMNFAKDREFISNNPAHKLAMPAKHTVDDRDPFSMETISTIFSCDEYLSAAARRYDPGDAAWFWVPLLSLFMGLRLGEACQLHVADVIQDTGIAAIKIEDNDLGGENQKRLKTTNSKRIVPCHPVVLEFGLLSFVQRVAASGNTRLFANEHRGVDTYFSPFSKRYSRFLSSIDCKTRKTSFHSFRHNCKDALTEAGVPDKLSNAIGGWRDATDSTASRYGSRSKMQALQEAIAKVSYPTFPFRLLRNELK